MGATGSAGAVLRRLLTHRADVWGEIRLLDPAPSPYGPSSGASRGVPYGPSSAVGRTLPVRDEETEVRALTEENLAGVDLALFLLPDELAARWAPVAVARGTVVVDTSAAFRAHPEVPLVVPEINAHAALVRPRGIIASPGAVTLTGALALGALHAEFGLAGLVVTAQLAAGGAGPAGADALRAQLAVVAGAGALGTRPGDVRRAVGDRTGPFPGPLALNVLPWSDEPAAHAPGQVRGRGPGLSSGPGADPGGDSGVESVEESVEEARLRDETRRLLGLPRLPVSATCVRVPVIAGHSLSVHARFERPVGLARAHELLATAPGIVVCDDPATGDFPTPADVAGTDPAWVGRLRRSPDDERVLDFFVCADDLRKGLALNALQIAEAVARSDFVGSVNEL